MTVEELIKKLKKYDSDREVCLLDHRCIEAFPTELTVVRVATRKEGETTFHYKPVILD